MRSSPWRPTTSRRKSRRIWTGLILFAVCLVLKYQASRLSPGPKLVSRHTPVLPRSLSQQNTRIPERSIVIDREHALAHDSTLDQSLSRTHSAKNAKFYEADGSGTRALEESIEPANNANEATQKRFETKARRVKVDDILDDDDDQNEFDGLDATKGEQRPNKTQGHSLMACRRKEACQPCRPTESDQARANWQTSRVRGHGRNQRDCRIKQRFRKEFRAG